VQSKVYKTSEKPSILARFLVIEHCTGQTLGMILQKSVPNLKIIKKMKKYVMLSQGLKYQAMQNNDIIFRLQAIAQQ
jgi:hypothetical protein